MSTVKQYSDEMTGIIGKNDFKKEEKHPDIRGRSKIGGIWYWVSGWQKTAGNGTKFYSLAYTEMTADEAAKYEQKAQQRNAPQQRPEGQQSQQQSQQPPARQEGDHNPDASPDFDDDIPF